MRTTTCEACGGPVIQAVTEDGRLIDIDAAISARGVYVLQPAQDPRLPPLAHIAEGKWADRPARLGHANSCKPMGVARKP